MLGWPLGVREYFCPLYRDRSEQVSLVEEIRIMGIYRTNRLLTISLALAGGGILACALALSDIFLPRGSAMVVLVSIPPPGHCHSGRNGRFRMDL